MATIREIKKIIKSKPTADGAGVQLKRVFGYYDAPEYDPFLLLDDFRSNSKDQYIAGFPWHPHRGIETITYMLDGYTEHSDSIGNKGVIGPGDVQWMTAGSGIIHQEMPKADEHGKMGGFQLWANLPASQKMIEPRYRDLTHEMIPQIILENGVKIKIICGSVNGINGPVKDIIVEPEYLDVTMPKSSSFVHPVKSDHTVFAYIIEGSGYFDIDKKLQIETENLVLYDKGDEIQISSIDNNLRFLLIYGKPLNQPIAWKGPIVMNTQDELRIAFEEYQNDTFIK